MKLSSLMLQQTLTGHLGGVYCLVDGMRDGCFYSAGSDGHIVEWNPKQSSHGKALATTEDAIFAMSVDPESSKIYAGTKSGFLFVIQFGENASPRKMVFHQSSIHSLLKIKEHLYAFSADGRMSVWSEEMKLLHAFEVGPYKLRKAIYIQELDQIVFSDGSAHLWSYHLSHQKLQKEILIPGIRMAFSLLYDAKNKILLAGGMDARIHRLSLPPIRTLGNPVKAHWYTINELVGMEPYGWMASASRDKSIRIWNLSDLSLLKDLAASKEGSHTFSVNSLLWIRSLDILVSASDDGSIKCWKPVIEL
ncbi:MAG: hypothetical protein IPM48_04460 [Saprospiraceae bacterium]|nr:hypothetical protein [Saprospiraceae bacterium]